MKNFTNHAKKIIESLLNIPLKLKKYYYKRKFKVKHLDIYFPIFINSYENINIGENCAINAFVHIWANENVTIGNNSLIASHVQICTSTHDYNHHPYRDKRIDSPIKIGNNVWIGSGAIILPGISIGNNSVIGAGSLVTKNIPENCIAYGVPARVAKKLNI